MASLNAYLGIDGGGSKTRSLLIDAQAKPISDGLAKTSNPYNIGYPEAACHIDQAVQNALAKIEPDRVTIVSIFCGIAGVRNPEEQQKLANEFTRYSWAKNAALEIDHDLAIAYEASLGDQPGICLISGTGSSCIGKDSTGAIGIASGHDLDDANPGSGYAIGRDAIDAGLVTSDSSDRKAIADLAQKLIAKASQGDESALSILEENAEALVILIRQTHSKIRLSDTFDIATTGGLGTADTIYRALLLEKLVNAFPEATIRQSQTTPVEAAARLAIRHSTSIT